MDPYAPPHAGAAPADAMGKRGVRALIYAILALLLCAPIFSPLAFVEALPVFRADSPHGKSAATAAVVIAILSLVFSAVVWLIVLWQFLSPADRAPR
jgi:hypothetical protein